MSYEVSRRKYLSLIAHIIDVSKIQCVSYPGLQSEYYSYDERQWTFNQSLFVMSGSENIELLSKEVEVLSKV